MRLLHILTSMVELLVWSITIWVIAVVIIVLALLAIACAIACIYVAAKWCARRLKQLSAWWLRTYGDELAQRRRMCEADARALGALKLPEWPS